MYQWLWPPPSAVCKILPEILVCREKKWYCAAFCTARQARRTFRIDRITYAGITDESAEGHGIAGDVKLNGLFGREVE